MTGELFCELPRTVTLAILIVLDVLALITHTGYCNHDNSKYSTASLQDYSLEDEVIAKTVTENGDREKGETIGSRDKGHQVHKLNRQARVPGKLKLPGKAKVKTAEKVRNIEEDENYCLTWVPTLSVRTFPILGVLVVNYCLHDDLGIPSTETCVFGGEYMYCTVVEKPACSHKFNRISTGNFTISVRALCDKCYEKIYYNEPCQTVSFEKFITVFERFVTTDIVSTPSSTPMTSDPEKLSIKSNVKLYNVIVAVSCGAIFILGLIACIIRRNKTRHPLTDYFRNFRTVLVRPPEEIHLPETVIPIPHHLLASRNSLNRQQQAELRNK